MWSIGRYGGTNSDSGEHTFAQKLKRLCAGLFADVHGPLLDGCSKSSVAFSRIRERALQEKLGLPFALSPQMGRPDCRDKLAGFVNGSSPARSISGLPRRLSQGRERPRNRLFEPKEFSIQVMNALREAEGNAMTTEAIAESIIKDKGLDEPAGRMIRGRCGHCAEGVAQAWDCGDDRRNAIALGHRMSRFRGLPQSATAPTRNCLDFG